jgi:uncharacterized protein (DUF433 family)
MQVARASQPILLDPFRTGKAYSIRQAARLARTTPATVRRWLMGYEAPGHQMNPVFGKKSPGDGEGPLAVSFLELVEIVVAAGFRHGGASGQPVKLERLRAAHQFARERFGLPYPFASWRLWEFGGHVLHDFDVHQPAGEALALDLHGQWVLPWIVQATRDQFEFSDEFVVRWFPSGRNVPIAVDPHMGAGRPTVVGTGVTVDTLKSRWEAGENISELAEDFDLEEPVIEAALRYAAA